MAQTPFVTATLPAATATTGVALPFTACDGTNGNSIVSSGREIVVVINIDTTPTAHTFTITANPAGDRYARVANFAMSVPGSTAFTASGLSGIVTPRLSSDLWSSSGLAGGLVLTPNSNDAHLVVGVITGT